MELYSKYINIEFASEFPYGNIINVITQFRYINNSNQI